MFKDRAEAGKKLAEALRRAQGKALTQYKGKKVLVLALPRGGVPVGYEIAKVLGAPLDTIVARKVGAPDNPEYAVGAIAPGGILVIDEPVVGIESVIAEETKEMERRMEKYKSGTYAKGAKPETVIIVDDGVATGKTALAAIRSARAAYPKAKVVFAAPVGALDAVARITQEADKVICLETPEEFMAVGEWYGSFPQLSDEAVVWYLEKASA